MELSILFTHKAYDSQNAHPDKSASFTMGTDEGERSSPTISSTSMPATENTPYSPMLFSLFGTPVHQGWLGPVLLTVPEAARRSGKLNQPYCPLLPTWQLKQAPSAYRLCVRDMILWWEESESNSGLRSDDVSTARNPLIMSWAKPACVQDSEKSILMSLPNPVSRPLHCPV